VNHYIDIFYVSNKPRALFGAFVWRHGTVVKTFRHRKVQAIAAWCQEQALPVHASDPYIRQALRECGIDVLPNGNERLPPPEQARAVGSEPLTS
jgi:hypothetical protein